MKRFLTHIGNARKGFTLVELLVAISIAVVIGIALATTVFQLFVISARSDSQMEAVRQVQIAGRWISDDTQRAESALPDTPVGSLVTLSWKDLSGHTTYTVVYTIVNGDLWRAYSENNHQVSNVIVAKYLDSTQTSFTLDSVGVTFIATVTVGDITQSHTYTILSRLYTPA
ncbi:hypothetical protein Dform_01297 [Dehalogenimonas formicexedens]|uniref:Prepilin-type N-terminal cleavage/methylation domain-containing protein n=1 Tax=Dehalogenimonas formicexedens TaxID=1839801 RepID=A0A1P8F852_9CHLR|nr:type II secretion system protein [Dehalogenimonas formicexedens]APV44625.1 hypothetical protein Dform_01297 [Dehalogenimonas formicexedens]